MTRSLDDVGKWKMREHHVFFMYFLYHVLEPEAPRLVFGLELLNAVKHLLLAMHLVKGFSAEVRTSKLYIWSDKLRILRERILRECCLRN